jgi:hypothetical protein
MGRGQGGTPALSKRALAARPDARTLQLALLVTQVGRSSTSATPRRAAALVHAARRRPALEDASLETPPSDAAALASDTPIA